MDFWEWVANYALDGIAAGIIGGLVTGGAVWATIRHERIVRLQDRSDSEYEALRRAVAEVLEGATSLRHDATGASELRAPTARFSVRLILVESLASRLDELLATGCRRNRNALMAATFVTETVQRQDVVAACDDLEKIATQWLFSTPDASSATKRAKPFWW